MRPSERIKEIKQELRRIGGAISSDNPFTIAIDAFTYAKAIEMYLDEQFEGGEFVLSSKENCEKNT